MSLDKQATQALTRGVSEVVPKGDLEKKLASEKKLRIKHGIDPTGSNIHIGHASVLWKLRAFQDLGHQIVLIVGDFTGMIGDTSDKQAMRQPLTRKEIEQNMKTYVAQFEHILDMTKVEIRYNSEWLAKLNFSDIVELAQLFTVSQLIERENFSERYQAKKPIGFHEFLYPLMQGYDSYAIKSDVELGGTDQLFNMMAGRKIQEKYGQQPQSVMTMELLLGLDGRKMSKTYENGVFINDSATDKFGKIMSMRDEMILQFFRLATDIPIDQIKSYEQQLKEGANPRDVKVALASAIVTRYHGETEAKKASQEFQSVFAKKELPQDIPTLQLGVDAVVLVDALVQSKLAASKGEARRLITQGGVKVDGKTELKVDHALSLAKKTLIQVGKRRFLWLTK